MKVHSNWKQSWKGEKHDKGESNEAENTGEEFPKNVIDCCRGAMSFYYLYLACKNMVFIAEAFVYATMDTTL